MERRDDVVLGQVSDESGLISSTRHHHVEEMSGVTHPGPHLHPGDAVLARPRVEIPVVSVPDPMPQPLDLVEALKLSQQHGRERRAPRMTEHSGQVSHGGSIALRAGGWSFVLCSWVTDFRD